MTLPLSRFEKVGVIFEKRADGGLRVYSQDVPGFVLSHASAAKVAADVIPALETIIGELVGKRVRVTLQSERAKDDFPKLRADRQTIDYSIKPAA